MSITGRYGGFEDREFVAEIYDTVYASRNHIDVGFFVEHSTRTGGRILELGCGTGRILLPVARAGCRITGLDISPFMLAKCRQKLTAEPAEVQQRVKILEGNITGFQTGEEYSLAILPFRVFQHLISTTEQKDCLNCIHRHLVPGGEIILDLFNCYPPLMFDPRFKTEQEDQKDLALPGGRTLRCTGRIAEFHRELQYNDTELIYYVTGPDKKTERLVQAFPWRYFFRYEIEHLLELNGFAVTELYGDHDMSAYSAGSPEMIFLARKK